MAAIIPRKDWPRCLHCRVLKGDSGRRWLCRKCFTDLIVRAKYSNNKQKFGRKGAGHNGTGELPDPTAAMPMTEERLAVMRSRAELGLAVCHPGDARLPLD